MEYIRETQKVGNRTISKDYVLIPVWRWKLKIRDWFHVRAYDLQEGKITPFFRPWRYNPLTAITDCLPIPLCYLARFLWNAYLRSWYWKMSDFEELWQKRKREWRRESWEIGYRAGYGRGRTDEKLRISKGIYDLLEVKKYGLTRKKGKKEE